MIEDTACPGLGGYPVSSTAPMTGRISPWATPSFSHAAAGPEDDALQGVHDASQGAGRAPDMGLQMEMAEKLADGFGSHTSFEVKHKQGGHDQADEPGATCLCFPQRRFWVAGPGGRSPGGDDARCFWKARFAPQGAGRSAYRVHESR